MTDFSPKEVEVLGRYRYLRENGRGKTVLTIVGLALIAVLVIAQYAPTLPTLLAQLIYVVIIGGAVGWFFKVVEVDSIRAGRRLREQWELEQDRIASAKQAERERLERQVIGH